MIWIHPDLKSDPHAEDMEEDQTQPLFGNYSIRKIFMTYFLTLFINQDHLKNIHHPKLLNLWAIIDKM